MRGQVFEEMDNGTWDDYSRRDYAELSRELETEAARRGLVLETSQGYWGTRSVGVKYAPKTYDNIYLNELRGLFEIWLGPNGIHPLYVSDAADACECLITGDAWRVGAVLAGELAKEMER